MFCDTPQHIPLELFETIPPTMQLSIDDGSGPILYCTGSLCFLACLARIALTSPPISPGSTVTRDPSPWTSCERKARPVCESLSSTESVIACPESDVPAARKVMGTERAFAIGRMRATSASEVIWEGFIVGAFFFFGREGERGSRGRRRKKKRGAEEQEKELRRPKEL